MKFLRSLQLLYGFFEYKKLKYLPKNCCAPLKHLSSIVKKKKKKKLIVFENISVIVWLYNINKTFDTFFSEIKSGTKKLFLIFKIMKS